MNRNDFTIEIKIEEGLQPCTIIQINCLHLDGIKTNPISISLWLHVTPTFLSIQSVFHYGYMSLPLFLVSNQYFMMVTCHSHFSQYPISVSLWLHVIPIFLSIQSVFHYGYMSFPLFFRQKKKKIQQNRWLSYKRKSKQVQMGQKTVCHCRNTSTL